MPDEILVLFIFIITAIFILSLTKMILNHRKGKTKDRHVPAESGSLTTSELEGMMRRAVEQSLTGISGKLEDLELEVAKMASQKPQLVAHDVSSRLELDDEVLDIEPVSAQKKSTS